MPPPGWYDDPEQPWTWRYWDGAYWTGHRAPMWVPPGRSPTSLSAWFEQSVAAGKIAVRRLGLVLAVLWLVLGAAGWWVVVASLGSDRGRELRRLLEIESELTAPQADRVWVLIRDIFVSALPWLMLLVVALMVSSAYSIALVARVVRTHVEHSARSGQPDVAPGSVFTGAARRVPAVLGAGIVVVAVYAAGWAVGAVLVALVVFAGGGAVAIVLTAIFVIPLVVVVTAWLWGRLTLATVIAADGGHGIGVRRSWELTEGRFWFAVGRLLVTAMIAGAAGGVVNALTGFGQFLGFVVFLAMVVLLQALAFGVSIIVTTCGHLAALEQLVADRPQ
jgi:hypothetical protein